MADFDAQPGRLVAPLPDLSATQREVGEAELYAGLRGVAGIVAGGRGALDLLRDVAEFAAQAIPGAEDVGVALIDPRHGLSRSAKPKTASCTPSPGDWSRRPRGELARGIAEPASPLSPS